MSAESTVIVSPPTKARWYRQMAQTVLGLPGDRPIEERAALGASFLLGGAAAVMVPINTAMGLPGPWLLLASILSVHCFGTWFLFRTGRVGRELAGWSIFLLGTWAGSWYFANFAGSQGPAPSCSLPPRPSPWCWPPGACGG